ncbi:hypothetical protein RVIR1_08530 [Candidatus Rickettsiella viridis]|uniref:Uncharacterized protein n=1 Tax=Candidatus Rickettsiella viridis TaxID=676208 RepID=A0A2Z5UUL0_9COXI|nr:hypothetical protein [Candidatus Rickettsiella viridis]BBB15336.1 hypothetical protein RVIR1_08530 [Candidatus Rickettsiella viridis]
MYLEQAYTLLQTYLENIDNYQFKLNTIDEKTSFVQIGNYIEEELEKLAQKTLASDINSLHEQLEYIIYLSKLFYYYANSINALSYFDKYLNQDKYIQRLKKISELTQKKQRLLNYGLQIFIKGLSQEDKAVEDLIENEIKYLETICDSQLSSEAEEANQSYLKIDIKKIKSQSTEDSKQLQATLDRYKDRCRKGNQYETPYGLTKNTTMLELENDTFAEQEKNSPSDSGNCSDDDSDSNKSFYYSASEGLGLDIDQETPSEPTVYTEAQDKLTHHAENQEQSPSNKNNLLTRLLGLLIRIWQHIKHIFTLLEKNDELNNTNIVNPSHPIPQQNTFGENIPPIATETKKTGANPQPPHYKRAANFICR